MLRAAVCVALLCASALATAPVPPPSEKELIAKHWGKPEGDGGFELRGGRLALRLAGENGSSELRVVRTVRGDFTAEVTVVAADCPDPTKDDAREPNCNAGLRVSGGGCHLSHYLFQQYHRGDDGALQREPQRSVWTDRFIDGKGGSGNPLKDFESGQSVYLRVARSAGKVSVSYSLDGKVWDGPHTFDEKLDFPDEVTVALFVSQTARQKLSATFEAFTITQPKK